MSRQHRRQFLATTLTAFGGFAIAGTKASGRILGANETLRVAVAGLNGRGGAHVDAFTSLPGVTITYLVDPDTRTFATHLGTIKSRGQGTPTCVQDLRTALDDKNVDVVSIASTNHWHALQTVWSCQAGKDVYVEKPVSHNLFESRAVVQAAQKHNRIVQHGTQGRSESKWWRLRELVESGQYGKLLVSRGLVYKRRDSIGRKPDTSAPAELDYNIWLGPAPEHAFNENYVHYNWHWFWDFGNGDIGNQGVHQMDIARWLIPGAELPVSALSLGGRLGYEDQAETPNTQLALFEFPSGTQLVFEVRGLPTEKYLGSGTGNILHLEAGTIVNADKFIPKGKTEAEAERLPRPKPAEPEGEQNHFANFLSAVRSRDAKTLHAPVEEAAHSCSLIHLANISYRLGQMVPFNSPRAMPGALAEAFERMSQHLADGNQLKLDGLSYHLGPKLSFDPQTWRFQDNPAADALISRTYRKPFTMPDAIG
jgi:predicted dehydrogenase